MISLPSTWNELTEEQFIQVINFRKRLLNYLGKAVKIYAGENYKRFPKETRDLIVNHSIDSLQWLKRDDGEIDHLVIKRTAGLDAVEIKDLPLHAYMVALDYLEANEGNEMLAACLYYDKTLFSGSDLRSIQERAVFFIDEPVEKKEAIRLNFQLIKNWLTSKYPYFSQAAQFALDAKLEHFIWELYDSYPLLEIMGKLNEELKGNMTEGLYKGVEVLQSFRKPDGIMN